MSDELQTVTHLKTRRVRGGTTVRDLWATFVSLKGDSSKSTLLIYAAVGRKFCAYMDGKEFTPETMTGYVRKLQEDGTMSGYTINHRNIRVRDFLRFMKKMGHLKHDLSEYIYNVKQEAPKPVKIFTDEEYENIKKWCAGKEQYVPHLWLIILGYRTGMSLIDCCNLRWKDVRLNENGPSYIDVYRQKLIRHGEKALCQIPIVPGTDVHQWLLMFNKTKHLNYKRFDGITDYVHQDCPGLYTYPEPCEMLRNKFKRIFRAAGIRDGKTFRNLRNTFCSNLVNSGAQLALICKMTGHQNVKTLLAYLKVDRASMSDELQKSFQHAAADSGTIVTETGIKI